MRKFFPIVVLVLLGLVAVEVLSSYALFRYFAVEQKALWPDGTAIAMLIDGLVSKVTGKHPQPTLTIDHGPLFEPNDVFGFRIIPGHFEIREQLGHQKHQFEVTVTKEGRRATSYVPVQSTKRLFIAGDSSIFGWGLDDEQTIPWLMQARLPQYQVINLSLNSYSTVDALLQLREMSPPVGPQDVVAVVYHETANKLNMEPPDALENLMNGYEMGLSDAARMREMKLPYGVIDGDGKLVLRRVSLTCLGSPTNPDCARPPYEPMAGKQVTEHVFDAIFDLRPARVVIMFLSGSDNDAVIAHARSRGATIADLRGFKGGIFNDDVIPTDSHMGPFWHNQAAKRLMEILEAEHVVD